MILISVIIPVYKAEKYIERCIFSILRQTFQNIEVILVDDGSPDKSGEICDMWALKDKRIKVIHQKNAGAGAARNAGLRVAKGEYIGFVDSDDWIEPQMYEVMYNAIEKYSADVGMCNISSRTEFSMHESYDNRKFPFELKNQEEMLSIFFRVHGEKGILSVCRRLIHKSVLKDFMFVEGTISEDVSAAYYFITHSQRTVVTNFSFYNYYNNKKGVTKSPVTMKDIEYIEAFKQIFWDVKKRIPKFERYAYINYIRANYTILSKMDLFGYDSNDQDLNNKHKELKQIVRKNFYVLLKWPMPISRKLLLLYVAF